MKYSTFGLKHEKSGSQAYVECAMKNGKAKIVSVGFAKGNVISLNDVREVLECATIMMRDEPDPFGPRLA